MRRYGAVLECGAAVRCGGAVLRCGVAHQLSHEAALHLPRLAPRPPLLLVRTLLLGSHLIRRGAWGKG